MRRGEGSPESRRLALVDDGELELEQIGDLAQTRQLVTDPERDVVRRALGTPGVEERCRTRSEPDS